jgi:hypothetical protein
MLGIYKDLLFLSLALKEPQLYLLNLRELGSFLGCKWR